ncbi:hypothetical protein [Lactococcus lactis]|uniref:hypothetical protein n=1 Tax=Lactococcus lactis TaxID=1358 RepID=UPI003D2F1510
MLKIKVEAVVKQRYFYRFSIIKIRFISFFNKQLASKMAEELIKDIESNFKKYFLL